MTFTGTEALMLAWAALSIGALIGVLVMGIFAVGARGDEE